MERERCGEREGEGKNLEGEARAVVYIYLARFR
jgi:hypothetical protein